MPTGRVQRVAIALGIVASIATIGQVFAPVRRWTVKRAAELYPIGWLVVAGVLIIFVVLAVVILARRGAARDQALAQASDTVASLERERDDARAELAATREQASADADAAEAALAEESEAARAQVDSLRRELDPGRRQHDRQILGEIGELLTRNVITFLAQTDLGAPWHRDMTHPVHVFANEFGDVEHRFLDRELEQLRRDLLAKAVEMSNILGITRSLSAENLNGSISG